MRPRRASRNGPDASGMRHRPRGPVGPSFAVGKSRGVGRRTTSYFIFQEPFGVPAVRSGAALSGFTLAPRVRIAPERSAFCVTTPHERAPRVDGTSGDIG